MKQIADSFAEQLLAVKAIKLQPNEPSHGPAVGNRPSILTTERLWLILNSAPS